MALVQPFQTFYCVYFDSFHEYMAKALYLISSIVYVLYYNILIFICNIYIISYWINLYMHYILIYIYIKLYYINVYIYYIWVDILWYSIIKNIISVNSISKKKTYVLLYLHIGLVYKRTFHLNTNRIFNF